MLLASVCEGGALILRRWMSRSFFYCTFLANSTYDCIDQYCGIYISGHYLYSSSPSNFQGVYVESAVGNRSPLRDFGQL
jgi:hypothetical protein